MFILFAILIFRIFAAIPVPMANLDAIKALFEGNQLLSMLNIFSGGGLSAFSIVMLGVMPYITAAIIMQLMTVISPKIKELQQEEGENGRRKIGNYSRLLSIPLAAIQAYGIMYFLQSQGILEPLTLSQTLFGILIAVAGSVFLMWLGELISEFGIGNGISLIIFAGIVATFPNTLKMLYETITVDTSVIPMYLGVLAAFLLMIYAVVYVNEAERPIVVHRAKASRATNKAQAIKSSIPIKLNQAGVMPLIFALALISFPQMILSFMQQSGAIEAGSFLEKIASFSQDPFYYGAIYFLLVFFFTYFYTAINFDPKRMAENLAKGGTYVPGVRPGEETEEYLGKVSTRITFFGAVFLSFVAVIPIAVGVIINNPNLFIGGTSLLIVVSVGIDLIKKINAQISVREYLNS